MQCSSSCKKHMNSEEALVHQSFKVLFLSRVISLDAAVVLVSWVVKMKKKYTIDRVFSDILHQVINITDPL